MMQLSVLSHVYHGDKTFAQAFVMKVLPSFKSNERAFNDFIFLKGLASAQESLSKGEQVSIENVRVMASLASKTTNEHWKWTVCVADLNKFSLPLYVNILQISLCLDVVLFFYILIALSNTLIHVMVESFL